MKKLILTAALAFRAVVGFGLGVLARAWWVDYNSGTPYWDDVFTGLADRVTDIQFNPLAIPDDLIFTTRFVSDSRARFAAFGEASSRRMLSAC